MNKQLQNSIQLSIGLLMMCVGATTALFFSSCKKKKETPPVATETFYTVSFDSKGGSEVKPVQVKKGNTITLPAGPTKADFIFGGWYTDREASVSPFSATTPITADITLYAKWNTATVFSLGSASFANGGEIPPKYAYPTNPTQTDRLNISPQLSWANAPAGTNSFLIIMEDLDVKGYAHWTAYNISANKSSVAEKEFPSKKIPGTMEQGGAYEGPWPPQGTKHTYQITIFALKVADNYYNAGNPPPINEEGARQQLGGNILASAFITGTFTSK